MMNVLYLAWQDKIARSWFPVGRLTFSEGLYRFVYTKGAKQSPHFVPFVNMIDLGTTYESPDLFPWFSSRLLSENRPDYQQFVKWMSLPNDEVNPIALLARSEGVRETDSLTVFQCPERDQDGKLHLNFFSHGIRHLDEQSIQKVDELDPETQLRLMPDPQNPHDGFAIALRTDDPPVIVGYCPRYLVQDFHEVLRQEGPGQVCVFVKCVNREAPIQFRLLCKLLANWPDGFTPFSSELYQPIAPP